MENVNICEAVLDKKLEGYSFEPKNFVAGSEITVTITLAEYRNLVANDATSLERIKKADADKYAREGENKLLKEENDRLKAELYELQKKLELKPCSEKEDTDDDEA